MGVQVVKLTAIRERGKLLGWIGQIDENTWAAAWKPRWYVTEWRRDLPDKTTAKQWLRKMHGKPPGKRK